jgi:probable O-glycosylation ligase (exosortase A-associated)
VLYTIILVAAPQEFVGALKPLRIALIVGVCALIAHAIDRAFGKMRTPAWPVELTLVVLLLGWAVAMVPLSYHPGGSVEMIVGLFLKSIAVFLLLASVVDTRQRLNTVVIVLMGCGALIAVTAIRHHLNGTMTQGTDRIAGYGQSSMAGNPNDLALLLNIIIPIAAMWSLTATGVLRLVGVLVVGLLAAGVVVTFSRGGFLTLALISMLLLWRFARRGAFLPLAAGVIGLVAVLAFSPSGLMERLSTVANVEADESGSAQERWRDTVAATQFFVRHPVIGAGAGLDVLALNELRGREWLPVHNVYLNYAVDLGVIGLGLFLAVFATVYLGVVRLERHRFAGRTSDRVGAMAAGIRISLVGFGLAGLFHPVAYHAYFYYLAGLAVAVRRIAAQPEEHL